MTVSPFVVLLQPWNLRPGTVHDVAVADDPQREVDDQRERETGEQEIRAKAMTKYRHVAAAQDQALRDERSYREDRPDGSAWI